MFNRKLMLWNSFIAVMLVPLVKGYQIIKNDHQEINAPVTNISTIEGQAASFFCPLIAPLDDEIYMVLWFRDDAGLPLYSFDVRGKALGQALHWSAPQVFGTRAKFITTTEPAYLELTDVKRHDQGIYRCRVDFRTSQTQSFKYNLTVIIPPEPPIVLDRWGRQINSSTIGPKEEGDDVILTCRVTGGRPQPDVRWLINGILVDDQYEKNSGNVIENRLLWPSIQRHDLHSVFTCQAQNYDQMKPKEGSYVLDMFLKPLSIKILNATISMIAERKYELMCESVGSRPEASIYWFKGRKPLKKSREVVTSNSTVSTLIYTPTTEDDGKTITCRAENPKVTGLFLETIWTMSVYFPPFITLRIGSSLSSDDIKEGDDVYFECAITANPQWRRLTWLHNGMPLGQNISSKIVRSNQSLVLQKVNRFAAGDYQCSALNSEGETVSNELALKIKYVPQCATDKVVTLGASKGETVYFNCDISTHPLARKFYWKFENSEEMIEIEQSRFTNNGTTSLLHFTPVTDQDFGTLSCWAKNDIGTQLFPCIFQLILAGIPTPITNCSWRNDSDRYFFIKCMPGYDGGLKQVFVLEVISLKHNSLKYNQTNPNEPDFRIDSYNVLVDSLQIAGDDPLRIVVYSRNSKGRSQPLVLTDFVLGTRSLLHEKLKSGTGVSPFWIGVVALVLVVMVVILLRFCRRYQQVRTNYDRTAEKGGATKTSMLKPETRKKLSLQNSLWRSTVGNGISKKGMTIVSQDDDSDPDLIRYPRVPNNKHHEEIMLMSTKFSGANSDGGGSCTTKRTNYDTEQTSDSEIDVDVEGIQDLLMKTRVPESCV